MDCSSSSPLTILEGIAMRYIVTVAVLILSFAPTASYAQAPSIYYYDPATHSCGKYLAAVHGHPPGAGNTINHPRGGQFSDDHHGYMAWLGGFFTATNQWVLNGPSGIQSDHAAIDVWIRKWCEQNPTKRLIDAASEFVWDQRKDYLEAWLARQAR
jgi:hypothetical protein